MKKILSLALISAACLAGMTLAAPIEPGFKSLFNGRDLTGWAGRTNHWSVEDGAITGVTTKENPAKGNNFLIATEGGTNLVVSDFEIRFSYRFTGDWGNSGLQYRSRDRGNFVVNGYQGDFEVGTTYSGILYEEGGRAILGQRGQKTVVKEENGKTRMEVVGSVGDPKSIQAGIKTNGWNDYVIIAQGNHLQHFINGRQTVDVIDEQESKAAKSGILAFQIHAGLPMKVQFKDIRIKQLGGGEGAANDAEKIQGAWVASAGIINGNTLSQEQIDAIQLTITGGNYRSVWMDGSDKGSLKLDPAATPGKMDVTSDEAGHIEAIYQFNGEELRICYGLGGSERPGEFDAPSDSKRLLITYRKK